MTDKKCPKCGSRNFQIVDYYTRPYIYEVEDGKVMLDGITVDATYEVYDPFADDAEEEYY